MNAALVNRHPLPFGLGASARYGEAVGVGRRLGSCAQGFGCLEGSASRSRRLASVGTEVRSGRDSLVERRFVGVGLGARLFHRCVVPLENAGAGSSALPWVANHPPNSAQILGEAGVQCQGCGIGEEGIGRVSEPAPSPGIRAAKMTRSAAHQTPCRRTPAFRQGPSANGARSSRPAPRRRCRIKALRLLPSSNTHLWEKRWKPGPCTRR
ncbi:hypothetical protein GEOBC_01615 [Geobacteraceae bacterium]|nr:hypothetical protein GEOBC_01615 [Geobacteraceae bacterium]